MNNFNDTAHTGGDVYNDVWIDCRYDSKFAACCGADGKGDDEIKMLFGIPAYYQWSDEDVEG